MLAAGCCFAPLRRRHCLLAQPFRLLFQFLTSLCEFVRREPQLILNLKPYHFSARRLTRSMNMAQQVRKSYHDDANSVIGYCAKVRCFPWFLWLGHRAAGAHSKGSARGYLQASAVAANDRRSRGSSAGTKLHPSYWSQNGARRWCVMFAVMRIALYEAQRTTSLCSGTFTGASALAWALALPSDGHVISMDVSHTQLDRVGRPVLEKRPDLLKKIDFRLGSALETLGGSVPGMISIKCERRGVK